VLKAGLRAYQRGQEALAEFGEVVEDLVAETDAELKAEKAAAQGRPAAEAGADIDTASPGESGKTGSAAGGRVDAA
jgi:hypothetical protein